MFSPDPSPPQDELFRRGVPPLWSFHGPSQCLCNPMQHNFDRKANIHFYPDHKEGAVMLPASQAALQAQDTLSFIFILQKEELSPKNESQGSNPFSSTAQAQPPSAALSPGALPKQQLGLLRAATAPGKVSPAEKWNQSCKNGKQKESTQSVVTAEQMRVGNEHLHLSAWRFLNLDPGLLCWTKALSVLWQPSQTTEGLYLQLHPIWIQSQKRHVDVPWKN